METLKELVKEKIDMQRSMEETLNAFRTTAKDNND